MHVCISVFFLIRKVASHSTEEEGAVHNLETVGEVCLRRSGGHSPNHSHISSALPESSCTLLPHKGFLHFCLRVSSHKGGCSATGRTGQRARALA